MNKSEQLVMQAYRHGFVGISLSARDISAKSLRNAVSKFNKFEECDKEFLSHMSRDQDHLFIMALPKLNKGVEINAPARIDNGIDNLVCAVVSEPIDSIDGGES
jgi:hypothetical protein